MPWMGTDADGGGRKGGGEARRVDESGVVVAQPSVRPAILSCHAHNNVEEIQDESTNLRGVEVGYDPLLCLVGTTDS